jgi:hypothetical protein
MTLANMRELGVHYRLTVFGMRAVSPVLGPVEIQGSIILSQITVRTKQAYQIGSTYCYLFSPPKRSSYPPTGALCELFPHCIAQSVGRTLERQPLSCNYATIRAPDLFTGPRRSNEARRETSSAPFATLDIRSYKSIIISGTSGCFASCSRVNL